MKKVGFQGDLPAFFEHLRTDPANFFPNTDAGQAGLSRPVQGLHRLDLRRRRQVLQRAAEGAARSAPRRGMARGDGADRLLQPADAGRQPARASTTSTSSDMTTRQKHEMETVAYHEGAPGHHFQIAIQQELEGVPTFQKFAFFGAYIEGWGLYAERLAKEQGRFTDPMQDFGRLQNEMLRACRLVVDTGAHSKKWTREQMIEYMLANNPMTVEDATKETERYIDNPGQALSYKIGMLKILELREKAKTALGDALRHPRLPRRRAEERRGAAADPRRAGGRLHRREEGGLNAAVSAPAAAAAPSRWRRSGVSPAALGDDREALVDDRVLGRDRHQDADHVAVDAAGQQDQAEFARPRRESLRQFGRRPLRVAASRRVRRRSSRRGGARPRCPGGATPARRASAPMRSPTRSARSKILFLFEYLEHRERGRAGDRIARVGAAEPAGPAGIHDVGAADDGRQREAAARATSRACRGRRRRRNAPSRTCVPVRPAPLWISSATSRMPWRSQSSRSRSDEFLRRDVESAFALHRLEHDRRHAIRRDVALEDLRERVEGIVHRHAVQCVRERRVVDLGRVGPEARLVWIDLAGQRERHQRAAVESARERDHRRRGRWPRARS